MGGVFFVFVFFVFFLCWCGEKKKKIIIKYNG